MCEAFANSLRALMPDDQNRNQVALAYIEISKEYSVESIYKQWEKLFENLKNDK